METIGYLIGRTARFIVSPEGVGAVIGVVILILVLRWIIKRVRKKK